MKRRAIAIVLVAAGALLGLGYATGAVRQPYALAIALLLFCVGGMLIPGTYAVADQLRPWLGADVRATAWGKDLPGYETVAFRFRRTMALGVGLHFYLLPQNGDKPLHLKIAQPRFVSASDEDLEIGAAKYVQWCGRKIKRVEGEKALVLHRVQVPLSTT